MAEHASAVLVIDLSTPFSVWIATIDGVTTHVVPAAARTDAQLRARIGAYMRGHGVDCHSCPLGCPMARLRSA